MKILILGASGTIGSAIYKCLSARYNVYGTYNKNKPDHIDAKYMHQYDIADSRALENILSLAKPDLIISSLTGSFEHQANIHERIAEYLKNSSGHCIFLSTANVFDGSPDDSHTELDMPYPISQYGKYKYSCEQLLQNYLGSQALIIRLPKTLSSEDALKELQNVENGQPVYANFFMSCNTAGNVAEAILFCIEAKKCGIVHLSSTDTISHEKLIELLLSKYNKNFPYAADSFTTETYCKALGCNNTDLLRHNNNDIFCMALKSIHSELPAKFNLSCEDFIASL